MTVVVVAVVRVSRGNLLLLTGCGDRAWYLRHSQLECVLLTFALVKINENELDFHNTMCIPCVCSSTLLKCCVYRALVSSVLLKIIKMTVVWGRFTSQWYRAASRLLVAHRWLGVHRCDGWCGRSGSTRPRHPQTNPDPGGHASRPNTPALAGPILQGDVHFPTRNVHFPTQLSRETAI